MKRFALNIRNFMRDKPLRFKIIVGVFVSMILINVAGTIINAAIIHRAFAAIVERDIENSFLYNLEKINNTTSEMINSGKAVALVGEILFQIYNEGHRINIDRVCTSFLQRKVEQIPVILGSGIWYEPYVLGGRRFFGPYAYWENKAVKITWEYNTPSYNYVEHHWYTIAIPKDWDRSKKRSEPVYITRPYHDYLQGEKITFLTMSIPMYAPGGRIIGVSTTDWVIEVIHSHLAFLNDFFYTPNSFVALVDSAGKTMLYHSDRAKIMKDLSSLSPGLSIDPSSISPQKTRFMRDISIGGRTYDVLARRTDAGFYFVMAVPPGESYAAVLRTMGIFIALSLVVIGAIIVLASRFINASVIKRVLAINRRITGIEQGDYTGDISFDEQDELTHIADNIRHMAATILQREQQLVGLQRYLSNIIESMPSMLFSLKQDGTVSQWNAAATRITGVSAGSAIGAVLWDFLPQFTPYRPAFEKAVLSNEPQAMFREVVTFREQRYFNISIFPLTGDGERGGVFLCDDITDVEYKDMQLRQAQKMEIVGTLAGGLAHDFNNVLAGIIGTTSLLKYRFVNNIEVPREELDTAIETVDEAAKRAAEIVQQLLVLARKHEYTFVPVDINESVERVMKICRTTFDKSVEIQSVPNGTPALVQADPVQMEQVILNLCVNGYHAMTVMRGPEERQGGVLTVTVDFVRADERFMETQPDAEPGRDYWIVSVRDTGVGMEQKMIAKIFDPFFTTKLKGYGTGLGLSMVYNIVKQHQGFINIYSEPQLGSSFNIYLPAHDTRAVAAAREREIKVPRGTGLILVIEDEPAIRNTVRTILEICGYTVLLAENGEEGLKIFRERLREIDMVLLDMVMPRRSGRDTFLAMKEINDGVRVLLSSGFSKDERVEEIMSLGVIAFIQKPYTMERLATAVWEVMNRKG